MADRVFNNQPFGILSGSSFPVITGTVASGATISRYDICYFDTNGAHKESNGAVARTCEQQRR